MANFRVMGGGNPSGMHNYSTSEQIVGTWVDGKTLYEKTIEITTPSTTSLTVVYNELTADMQIYFIEGVILRTSGSNLQSFTITTAIDSFNTASIMRSSTELSMVVAASLVNCPAKVTIRYTKNN